MKNFLLVIIFLFIQRSSFAQNLTGTWEGKMGHEILQLNILQKGQTICGYSHDWFINNSKEYCKALFSIRYDKSQQIWFLNGTSFIENSGTHVLMRMRLWREPGDDRNTMRAVIGTKSGIMGMMMSGNLEEVILKKKSSTPNNLQAIRAACFPDEKPVEIIRKPATRKPAPTPPPPPAVKKQEVLKKTDTLVKKTIEAAPIVPKKENKAAELASRKKNNFGHIVVDVKNIFLKVYDNGIVDGDTVSIYHNGKLLVNKQRLSEKALEISLELDETGLHEITLFAENLGSIPPNTALVVVTAGDKRYELYSSASLKENAVLLFEYKPKAAD